MPASTTIYHCVHCMAPSESTYKKYSREIKLTTCQKCGQNVDPYVERDWLLVAMDCILLRDEAYRHVLCNRPNVVQGLSVFRSMLGSALLQGYLLLQENQSSSTIHDDNDNNAPPSLLFLTLLVQMTSDDASSIPWWIPLLYVVYAFLGNAFLLVGMQIPFALWRHRNASRLSLAILLPTLFHVVTILVVVVWENTTVVRQLASLLVLCYQYLTTTVVMQLHVGDDVESTRTRLRLVAVFVGGLVARALGLTILRYVVVGYTQIPCLLGIDVGAVAGVEAWNQWTVCLC